MILFQSEHIPAILEGRKTQTRRLGARRWKVGSIHQARTYMFMPETTFARLKILEVRREQLGVISEADLEAEGYPGDKTTFLRNFQRINADKMIEGMSWLTLSVWVIKFQVERALNHD